MKNPLGSDPERALVPLAGAPSPIEQDVDVARLARGLWRRRWKIVVLAAALSALIAVPLLVLRADSWEASARVVVQPVRANFTGTPLESHVFASADLETAIKLVTVDQIVEAVARALDLEPETLLKRVNVHPQDRSRVISFTATGESAEQAAHFANTFLDTAVGHYHRGVAQLASEAIADAQARVNLARGRTSELQEQIDALVSRHGFVDESELPKVTERLRESERRLGQLEGRQRAVESQLARTRELLEQQDPHVRSVSSSSSPRASSQGFWDQFKASGEGAGTPWVKAGEGKPKGSSTSTVSPNPVRQSLLMATIEQEAEVLALGVEVDRANADVTALRAQQEQLPTLKNRLQALLVERDHALEDMNRALSVLSGLQAVERMPEPILQVVERAKPPLKPERTRRLLLLALAGLLGLGVSFGWHFLKEFGDTRIRDACEVEALGIPVLACLDLPADAMEPPAHEALAKVAYGLRRYGRETGPFCVLFTSATPGEGKTRLAREVARVLAEWGDSVLRIDANFRGATGLPGHLERYLSGEAEQPSLLKYRNGLYAITCGGGRADSAALLASDWMERLLHRARASFAVAVVDGPSVEPGIDAALLVEKVDAVVLVVRAERVRAEVLRRAIQRIRETGVAVIGAVIVGAQPSQGEVIS